MSVFAHSQIASLRGELRRLSGRVPGRPRRYVVVGWYSDRSEEFVETTDAYDAQDAVFQVEMSKRRSSRSFSIVEVRPS